MAASGVPDDAGFRWGDQLDLYALEHRLLRELEMERRQVRRAQILEQRSATAEEQARVRERWESAVAAWRNNEVERQDSWGAEDLEEPPPWWKIEAELLSVPEPVHARHDRCRATRRSGSASSRVGEGAGGRAVE